MSAGPERQLHIDHDHGCPCQPRQNHGTSYCGRCVRGLLCVGHNIKVARYEKAIASGREYAGSEKAAIEAYLAEYRQRTQRTHKIIRRRVRTARHGFMGRWYPVVLIDGTWVELDKIARKAAA